MRRAAPGSADFEVRYFAAEQTVSVREARWGDLPGLACFVVQWRPDFKSWHGVENWRAILRRPWKYVLHQNGEAELYNIVNDPDELKNLARQKETQEEAASLQRALLSWSQRTGDPFAKNVAL